MTELKKSKGFDIINSEPEGLASSKTVEVILDERFCETNSLFANRRTDTRHSYVVAYGMAAGRGTGRGSDSN
jgi:hypothetical protein